MRCGHLNAISLPFTVSGRAVAHTVLSINDLSLKCCSFAGRYCPFCCIDCAVYRYYIHIRSREKLKIISNRELAHNKNVKIRFGPLFKRRFHRFQLYILLMRTTMDHLTMASISSTHTFQCFVDCYKSVFLSGLCRIYFWKDNVEIIARWFETNCKPFL
jgi:hypothetical protein